MGKETGDCVVRAVAVATGRSWRDAYWALCETGAVMGDLPNSNAVWGSYLRELGAKQFLLPESCPECITVRAFSERYPEGTYIIGTGEHAIAVIGGDWYDIHDSGGMVPTFFWRIR